MVHIHTLGDYRDALEPYASYPDAGRGTERARACVALGLNASLGAVSDHYLNAAPGSEPVRRDGLQAALAGVAQYIIRSVIEHHTGSAGLLWGHSIADMQKPAHVDNPAHAWLSVLRIAAQTDFAHLFDVQALLRGLLLGAAREGWTLQDLAFTHIAALAAGDTRILETAGEAR